MNRDPGLNWVKMTTCSLDILKEITDIKGEQKNPVFPKNGFGSGGRTVCPERLSFSQFVVLMRTTICEKDSLPGQRVLPPEPKPFLERQGFFCSPFMKLEQKITGIYETYFNPKKLSYFITPLHNKSPVFRQYVLVVYQC